MNNIVNIADFKKYDNYLSTSGQPTESEIKLIADEGFKEIVNIRPESEMLDVFDEKSIVENLGLEYFQIPMTFDTLNNDILAKFFEKMDLIKEKKIFIHCKRNIRVSVLIALYNIIKLGWKKEEAIKVISEDLNITPEFESYLDHHISNYSAN